MRLKLRTILAALKFQSAFDLIAAGPSAMSEFLFNVENKAFRVSPRLKGVRSDIVLALKMIKATAKGEYKGLAKDTLVIFVAVFLYFLNPLDLIPDFLTPIGFTDDLSVLIWAFTKFRGELNHYKEWLERQEEV